MTLICQKVCTFVCFAVCMGNGCSPWGKLEKRNNLFEKRFKKWNVCRLFLDHFNNNLWVHFKHNPRELQVLSQPDSQSKSPEFSLYCIARADFGVEPFNKVAISITDQTPACCTARCANMGSININFKTALRWRRSANFNNTRARICSFISKILTQTHNKISLIKDLETQAIVHTRTLRKD